MTRWCVNVNTVFHFWEVGGGFVQRRCVSIVCIDIYVRPSCRRTRENQSRGIYSAFSLGRVIKNLSIFIRYIRWCSIFHSPVNGEWKNGENTERLFARLGLIFGGVELTINRHFSRVQFFQNIFLFYKNKFQDFLYPIIVSW